MLLCDTPVALWLCYSKAQVYGPVSCVILNFFCVFQLAQPHNLCKTVAHVSCAAVDLTVQTYPGSSFTGTG